jgi:lipid II:glycine glycyltransferase (peptidoglycan interpeptide bridge formation enzyme)
MSVIITQLDESDYSSWNEFIHNSPQESFLYTTEWATLISYVFNRQFDIAIALKNDRIICGCIVFSQRKFGYNIATPVPFFPYNGPVFEVAPDVKYQKIIAVQLDLIKKLTQYLNQQYKLWILKTPPDIKDVRGFQWSGCRISPGYNYILNLSDWEYCQENFNQNVRKKIRHADSARLKIEESGDKQTMIDLYLHSYRRHKIKPLVPESDLRQFLDMALKLPQCKLYYCRDETKILAGRFVLRDDHILYDLLAGSADDEGLASTFLVYNILKSHADTNYIFDFMGADHPQIEEFKRGFGGELVNGYQVTGPLHFPMSVMVKLRVRQLKRSREL